MPVAYSTRRLYRAILAPIALSFVLTACESEVTVTTDSDTDTDSAQAEMAMAVARRLEAHLTFLADDKWKEYGVVYRYRKPGCLAVHTAWKDGPTTFTFKIQDARITVAQDGATLGTAVLDAKPAAPLSAERIRWGRGVFGPFRGRIEHHEPRAAATNDNP